METPICSCRIAGNQGHDFSPVVAIVFGSYRLLTSRSG